MFGCSAQPSGTTRRITSLIASVEMTPTGSHAAIAAAGVYIIGFRIVATPSRHDPGPSEGNPRCSLKAAPPEREALDAASPFRSSSPSNDVPPEWATMNHGGTPDASSAATTEPAEVPTM